MPATTSTPRARPAPWWHTAVYFASVALAAAEVAPPDDGTPLWVRLVVWACAAVAIPGVLWRRERPWLLVAAGIVAAATGPTTLLAVGLFSYALRRRDRTTVAVAVLGALVLLTPWSLANAGTLEWSTGEVVNEPGPAIDVALTWLTRVAFVCGGSLALGGYLGARRDLLASLRERASRAEAERELRAGQAVLQERERISREMHDVLGHRLALLAMQAGALEVTAPTDQVRADAEVLRTTARAALGELRAVVHALETGPPPAEGGPGSAGAAPTDSVPLHPSASLLDIGALVAAYRGAGAVVTFDDEATPAALTDPPAPDVGRAAHRVVQEALTNAHKHAPGLPVRVALAGAPGAGLTVEVRNPRPLPGAPGAPAASGAASGAPAGVAADAGPGGGSPGGGTGLRGLAERVRLAGGSLTSGAQGPDFVLDVRLPWVSTTRGGPA